MCGCACVRVCMFVCACVHSAYAHVKLTCVAGIYCEEIFANDQMYVHEKSLEGVNIHGFAANALPTIVLAYR